jgi:hypothetical protein
MVFVVVVLVQELRADAPAYTWQTQRRARPTEPFPFSQRPRKCHVGSPWATKKWKKVEFSLCNGETGQVFGVFLI